MENETGIVQMEDSNIKTFIIKGCELSAYRAVTCEVHALYE